ncbi:MAG TPA: LytR C-terminal domain-containing protein [Solirubrobacteraceae bacterium]
MIIGGLLLIAGIVAVLVVVTSSSGTSGTKSSPAPAISNAPKPSHHRRLPALAPGQVTVAVLNGTSTTNLAHDVSLKLANAGYKQGAIATATDQTQAATTVGYMPGQRRAALIVARSLNLGPATVVPVTPPNRAVACPQAACTAQVVVTVGTDLASVANSSSAAPATGAASTTT